MQVIKKMLSYISERTRRLLPRLPLEGCTVIDGCAVLGIFANSEYWGLVLHIQDNNMLEFMGGYEGSNAVPVENLALLPSFLCKIALNQDLPEVEH